MQINERYSAQLGVVIVLRSYLISLSYFLLYLNLYYHNQKLYLLCNSGFVFRSIKPEYSKVPNDYVGKLHFEVSPILTVHHKTVEIIDNLPKKIQYTQTMVKPSEGYREIDHTADWALHVWARNLASLFTQAALGMYALAETVLQTRPRITRQIQLETGDLESLLVGFLNELLFISEQEIIGFDTFNISIIDYKLSGEMCGSQIISQKKEIKAVTYHTLEINRGKNGFEVQIVFDV